MPIGYSKYIPNISIAGDLFILNLVFVFYYVASPYDQTIDSVHILFFIYLNACWLVFSYITGALNIDRHTSRLKLITVTTQIFLFFIVAFLAYFQWNPDLKYITKEQKQIQFPVFFVLLLLWKLILHYSYFIYRGSGQNFRTMLIVGNTKEAQKLMRFINENLWHGYKCPGIVTIDKDVQNESIVGNIREIDNLISKFKADELFISMEVFPLIQSNDLSDLILNLPVDIRLIPNLGNFPYFSLETIEFGNIPVLALHPSPLSYLGNKLLKRSFDLVFSSLVMVLILSWMIPILWLIDKITQNYGLFFKQKRTSIYGKEFQIIKFRTMIPNDKADLVQAEKHDQRITHLGAFLRKTSIDELPQFINVFLNDMSVVGPRPHMLKHTEEYRKIVPSYMHRHQVKSGITGLAQVSGYRGEVKVSEDIEKRVQLDISYLRKWSFGLDIMIIIRTIAQMIKPI
jgi:putative colanic acid biosynthesis UDP-glucose lipid carrier transferase